MSSKTSKETALREGQPLIAEKPDPHRPHGHAVAQQGS